MRQQLSYEERIKKALDEHIADLNAMQRETMVKLRDLKLVRGDPESLKIAKKLDAAIAHHDAGGNLYEFFMDKRH